MVFQSLRNWFSGKDVEGRYNLSQYAQESVMFGGHKYPLFGYPGSRKVEKLENDFEGFVQGGFKGNGIVFACMNTRARVFSEVRFAFQSMEKGRPGEIDVPPRLKVLQDPWPNGGTRELLVRAIQDVDLAGNHYVVKDGNRLRRLRPDWVEIVLTAPPEEAVETDIAGYMYFPGGIGSRSNRSKFYNVEEVAHWAPIPDPTSQFRGMSWLSPVISEIESDKGFTAHKKSFVENAATPNLSVSLRETVTEEQFKAFVESFRESTQGVHNAYETLFLGGGADVKVVGANLQQLDFKVVQGAGETRIAAAAGVHPVVVGLSEGMQGSSLNAGNFKAAKDGFADGTLRPLWGSVCQAYSSLVDVPQGKRLWYDDREIPFLRTDETERAEVQQREASVIRTLVDGGFEWETIVDAVRTHDWNKLDHTGLVSVQLLPPGVAVDPFGGPGGQPGGGSPNQQPGGGAQPGRRPGGKGPSKAQSGGGAGSTPSAKPGGGGGISV